ncbi:MAG: flagellar basal body-associated FliL family protein [Acetobacteraceae bacterium]|nr:flagellar basal body-associated FliL family protein [Acetobacteraceae bacterium]
MSKAATATVADTAPGDKPAGGGRKKLILLAVPILLAGLGAGLWFSGILPPLLGMGGDAASHPPAADPHAPAKPAAHGAPKEDPHAPKPAGGASLGGKAPLFFELPDMIVNLNSGTRRTVYAKVKPRLELARAEDEPAVRAALPRLMDMFQTYLRETRPEELRGSAGMYRLREELLARANVAVTPARIVDVLFVELLIQ